MNNKLTDERVNHYAENGFERGYNRRDIQAMAAELQEYRQTAVKYNNLAEMEYQVEQAECVSRCLDELNIPKKEGEEDLSLWGRVFIYGVINADQAVAGVQELQERRKADGINKNVLRLSRELLRIYEGMPLNFWRESRVQRRVLELMSVVRENGEVKKQQ